MGNKGNQCPAVILAAGMGKRLGCETVPKPLVCVNGVAMLDNLMESIIRFGIAHAVIVTGHLAEKLTEHLTRSYSTRIRLTFVENEIYSSTNNIYSLWLTREYLKDGFYLFESDVFFEPALLAQLFSDKHDNIIVVDKYRDLYNGTVVLADSLGRVTEMLMSNHQTPGTDLLSTYKTVNFYKFGADYAKSFLVPGLDREILGANTGVYYEHIVKSDIDQGVRFHILKTGVHAWYEIDTPEDLKIAEKLFAVETENVFSVQRSAFSVEEGDKE